MTTTGANVNGVGGLLAAASRLGVGCDLDDGALLARFAADRDAVAFEVLVWRHGGLVRGVCRRYLADPNDADEATQATFIALARKAHSVRAVGPWLARVAAHAARRLRRSNATRATRQVPLTGEMPAPGPSLDDGWRRALAEEIADLPDHYRAVVRRCYLDGLSASEAAREFGWARGTVLTRLAWAKARLRRRLTTRGVTLGVGGVAGLLYQLAAGPVTRAAAHEIVRAVTGVPGSRVSQLTDGVLTAMFWTRVKFAAGAALVACTSALVGAAGSASDGRDAVAIAPAPRVVAATPSAGTGAADAEKSPKELAPRASNGPVKTKAGVGPGFGAGAGPGATPVRGGAGSPAKTKAGVGPGFGFGAGGGATPIRP